MLGTNYSLQTVLQEHIQHRSPFFLLCLDKRLHKGLIYCLGLLQCTSVNSNMPYTRRNLVKVILGKEQSITMKLVPVLP